MPTPLKAVSLIRDVPDFPQPGIVFKDITPILGDPEALDELITALADAARALKADRIAGIESRGFLFGAPVALKLGLGFAPIRKAGKLPYQTVSHSYDLEYGSAVVEAHVDAFLPGERVVIVDDLLATGGTASAAATLIERIGAHTVGQLFVIELGFLNGRKRLVSAGVPDEAIVSLITY